LRVDVPVADENVRPAIVIEIYKADAPAKEPRVLTQPRLKRLVIEDHLPQVSIEARSVTRKVRLYDVDLPIAIVVARRNTHPRLRLAVRTVGHTGFERDVCERSVMVVFVKRRRG